jgi:hypothetical protein
MSQGKIIEVKRRLVLKQVEKEFREFARTAFPKGISRWHEWELRRAYMLGIAAARGLYRRGTKASVHRTLRDVLRIYATTCGQNWRDQ